VLSYVLNNAYRINDQFWVQGLGGEAQAAVGASFYVLVMAFAGMFLAVGGTLALVSRATGSGDAGERGEIVRHALVLALVIGTVLSLVLVPGAPRLVGLLGLEGETARYARELLSTLYLFGVPLALFPVVDNVFIGCGNTRVPMAMQGLAVVLNYVLNPVLIYGARAAEMVDAPGAAFAATLAGRLGIEGMGMRGAAIATGLSRTVALSIGLVILRFGLRMPLRGRIDWRSGRIQRIVRISAPAALSIGLYTLTYWALLGLVITRLGDAVTAGLGLGFQVFEGVAFPCYLGVSLGAASLVGRAIGARDADAAWRVVHAARRVGRITGIGFAVVFLAAGPIVVPWFTGDPAVRRETLLYVSTLAFSQVFVAAETINEKVLLGAGTSRPILWIAASGNALRLPLGALLALGLGLGAVGVWWAINVSSALKAVLFWRKVQQGRWCEAAGPRPAPGPP